jgi:uncharacterized membrane protein
MAYQRVGNMPFILVFVGIALADLAWQGAENVTQAGSLLKNEMFGGSDPFYKWLGALILIGLLGYVPQARGLANALLILVILAIILSSKNFASFTKLLQKV